MIVIVGLKILAHNQNTYGTPYSAVVYKFCLFPRLYVTVMLQYFACKKPLRFCHFAANSSTLRSYLCDYGGGIPILGQSWLKWVCTLRFLTFCWLACFSNARFTLSFASRVATAPIAVSSRLGFRSKIE